MFTTMVAAYPWDLVDEGLDQSLERLKAEVGIQHMSLWAAAAPASYVRVRPVQPRWIRVTGGLTFAPDRALYHASRIKPVVATGLKGKDMFAAVGAACEKTGLTFSAVVSASCAGLIARRHPQFACKNVFGDVSQTSVCLNNPDVRAYLTALVEDVTTRYPVAWIELADFVTSLGEAQSWPLTFPAGSEPVARMLLGMCFCESCRHGAGEAGVPVESAARLAAVIIQQKLDREGDDILALVRRLDRPPLEDYLDWTGGELNQLLIRLARAAARPLVLHSRETWVETFQHRVLDGSLLDAGILAVKGIEDVPIMFDTQVSPVGRWPKATGHTTKVVFGAPPYNGSSNFPDNFVAAVSKAAEMGWSGVRIEDYPAWPAPAFDILRRAVRFARRITG